LLLFLFGLLAEGCMWPTNAPDGAPEWGAGRQVEGEQYNLLLSPVFAHP